MHTLIGWLEDIDQAGAYANLTALADQHVTVSGDDIRVPSFANLIIAAAACLESTVDPRCRVVSPSLRRKSNLYVAPINVTSAAACEPGSPHAVADYRNNPIEVVVGENMSVETLANPAAVQDQSVLVWLADGPIAKVEGKIFTVRATGATTLTANAWTNGAITFDEDLPRGRYAIVGMRVESAGLVAARAVLVGSAFRPGVLGADTVADVAHEMFRSGNMGVWGEFEDTDPPTIDYLSISADTAEAIYFDLIQLREGPGA